MTDYRDLARLARARVQDWIGRIFPHQKPVRYVLVAFVLVLVAAFATQCRAGGLQLEVGSTIVRGESPAIGFSKSWRNRGVGDYQYECGFGLVGSSTFRGREQRNQGVVECLLVDGFGRFDIGAGLAAQSTPDDYNTRANFSLLLRWRVTDRLSLAYRHRSNADTADPNLGRDLLLLGIRLQ
jgi:hypothetical protein